MNLSDALEKAKKLEEVEGILESGGFFCSAFTTLNKEEVISEWNLGFYSEESDEITAVKVTEGGANVGVTDEPLREKTKEVDIEKVCVGGEEALEKAREKHKEEFGGNYAKILLSLKDDEGYEWDTVFVGGGTDLIVIKISARSGEVLDVEKTSLVRHGESYGG